MTELNNVNLFGAMEHHLMVLFTVTGAMANQMTGLVTKIVLNFTTMAGMIWRALGITTTCARAPKVNLSLYGFMALTACSTESFIMVSCLEHLYIFLTKYL